jgi:hypothetical protein
MLYFRGRPLVLFGLPLLIVLSGCKADAPSECGTSEVRNDVLKSVSDDPGNRLLAFAAGNSTANRDSASTANPVGEKPVYALGEETVTTSTSADKRTFQCSAEISVTVGGTTASKEVDFTVQKAPDGRISVSVVPFQF